MAVKSLMSYLTFLVTQLVDSQLVASAHQRRVAIRLGAGHLLRANGTAPPTDNFSITAGWPWRLDNSVPTMRPIRCVLPPVGIPPRW